MELSTYLKILNRRKWIVLTTTLVTLIVFLIGRQVTSPTYETSTVLRVVPYSSGEPPYTQLIYADRIMNTYIELATSGPYLEELRQILAIDPGRPMNIKAEIIPNSELLRIIVKDQNPWLARDAANSLAEMLVNKNPLREIKIVIVDPAVLPRPPSVLKTLLNGVLALLIGMLGGVGLAFLFENLDTRLHTSEAIAGVTDLPVIGHIPLTRPKKKGTSLLVNLPADDAFRRLCINLLKICDDFALKTLLLTSAQPGEGKSTIVANLAIYLAQRGKKTIIVDVDIHRPNIHNFFDLPNESGLCSVLEGKLSLIKAIRESGFPGLWVLTCGTPPPSPVELNESDDLISLLVKLRERFDLVLLDAPAFLGVSDTALLAPLPDGILLVARRGQVRGKNLQTTIQDLKTLNPGLYGIIVNDSDSSTPLGYYRYYHRSKPIKTEITTKPEVVVIPPTAEVGIPTPSGKQENNIIRLERALIQRVGNINSRVMSREERGGDSQVHESRKKQR